MADGNADGTLSTRSLASSFVIVMCDDIIDSSKSGELQMHWDLVPISQIVPKDDNDDEDGDEVSLKGIGAKAIEAMMGEIPKNDSTASLLLTCSIEDSDWKISVESKGNDLDNDDDYGGLIGIISRVMVQKATQRLESRSAKNILISVPSQDDSSRPFTDTFEIKDVLSDYGNCAFFSELLPNTSKEDLSTMEMSDMVDANGEPIGYIPRPLIHKYNILHRGIGIVVCRDAHINHKTLEKKQLLPDLYVHRRTASKRIFPSLYDMFVGGVATAGEDLKLTAAREVGEELGLTRPSLSDEPLFRCTICTSYNRCVVTVYTYKCDMSVDEIVWQEEEVSWGDFVSYDKVEKAGALSIGRLYDAGKWSGHESEVFMALKAIQDLKIEGSGEEIKWDFVPDGLLVWVAWLKWLSR